jgi:hypothetical protein
VIHLIQAANQITWPGALVLCALIAAGLLLVFLLLAFILFS